MISKKKRFINKGEDIFQHGEWYCSAGGEHCAEVIATALNEVLDENEGLKKQIKIHKKDGLETLNDLQRCEENNRRALINIEKLTKENEVLKQKNDTLIKISAMTQVRNDKLNDERGQLKQNLQSVYKSLIDENEQLKQKISELELLNDGLNYALRYIKKIDVEIDVGDVE